MIKNLPAKISESFLLLRKKGRLSSILEKARSGNAKSASTLLIGTGVAQLIPVLISPLLTRIYHPREFGGFVVFSGVVALFAIGATGRYEHAILLPRSRGRAVKVACLAVLCSCSVALVTAVVIAIGYAIDWKSLDHSVPWFLLPVAVALFGPAQALLYLANRFARFTTVSSARVLQSTTTGGIQIAAGMVAPNSAALIGATIAGQISSILFLLRRFRARPRRLPFKSLLAEAKRYVRFPLFSLPADVINTAANQLPLLILMGTFGPVAAGLFGLTLRVLGMPLGLLANSVGDVFKSRAAAELKLRGNCADSYRKTFVVLICLSVLPIGTFALVSPKLFSFFFGHEWTNAGHYARILCLMYFFRFTASPLSYVLYITEKQTYDLCWQIALFLVVLGSLTIPGATTPEICLLRYSVGYSVMYVIYLGLSYRFARQPHVDSR